MKSFTKIFFLFAALSFFSCSGAGLSPQYGTYKKLLQNQMQEMSNVLFAGHNSEFLSTYVDPKYINSMGGVNQALLQFSNAEQQVLYRNLKVAQNVTPTYDDNSKTMTYTLSIAKPIAFKLINGKWYMTGDWFKN